ncbi:MAG: tetratricopeptide repeat protein [bacterium]
MEFSSGQRDDDVLEESPKEHMELGITYYINGDIDRAIEELKKALKLKPDYLPAFFNLALMLKEKSRLNELETLKGDIQRALALSIEKAKHEKPFDAKIHLELGVLFYIQGMYKEAEAEFRKAIELNPDYSLAYYNLAILLKEMGRSKEAK